MADLALILDDNADSVAGLESFLRTFYGLDSLAADSVAGAGAVLDATVAAGRRPVVCFVDSRLPGLENGFTFIPRLKAACPRCHAIVCTGFADAATEREAWAAGADVFLPKPLDSDTLMSTLETLGIGRIDPAATAEAGP